MEKNTLFQPDLVLTPKEHNLIKDLVYNRYGIELNDKKRSLVSGRLQRVLKEYKLNSFEEYYNMVIKDKTEEKLLDLIDHLTTNHTYFLREDSHFELLREKVLPKFEKKLSLDKRSKLRIWSAGCSSGEEVYTLKIIIDNFLDDPFNSFKFSPLILGTDISTTALRKAVRGEYTKEQLGKIPEPILDRYFDHFSFDTYLFKKSFRGNILFKRLNLMNKTFPFRNKFDIIFCRNVMIYFDDESRRKLINQFYNYLIDGGFLFLGLSETIGQNNQLFKYIGPSVYRKKRLDNSTSFIEDCDEH